MSRRICLVSGWCLCSNSQILSFTVSYRSTYWDPLSLPPFISPTLLFGGREPWCNTLARLPGQKPHRHRRTQTHTDSLSSALLSLTHQHPQIPDSVSPICCCNYTRFDETNFIQISRLKLDIWTCPLRWVESMCKAKNSKKAEVLQKSLMNHREKWLVYKLHRYADNIYFHFSKY